MRGAAAGVRAAAAATSAALALLLCAGCALSEATIGLPVADADAAKLAPGLTKPQVLERLGPPDGVGLERGGSAFEYLYSRTDGRALSVSFFRASFRWEEARTRVDRLRVTFDGSGRVKEVAVIPPESAADD